MRELKFIVKGQYLSKDDSCDFAKIVAGSECYLKAVFEFSEEWKGTKKAVSFWQSGLNGISSEEFAVILDDNNSCVIPSEVLNDYAFVLAVTGATSERRIPTNKIKVSQEVY